MFLGGSGDGNGWIYVDGTSGVEVACVSKWPSRDFQQANQEYSLEDSK